MFQQLTDVTTTAAALKNITDKQKLMSKRSIKQNKSSPKQKLFNALAPLWVT